MTHFILRRLLLSVFVVIGVVVVAFIIIRLSGDPSALMLPPEATREQIEEFRESMGFNDSIATQFGRFVSSAVRGDLGDSLRYREPALGLVLDRLPATMQLAAAGMAISLLISIPAGVISAVKKNSRYDNIVMLFALGGHSMPIFWLGIILILVFSVTLGLVPTSGSGSFKHLILPAFTLGLYSAGQITRLVRAQMLEVLGQDYIRTARAKGLGEKVVIYRHALRNALLPVITVIGVEAGSLLSGSVVTEVVFAWPGVGQVVVQSIFARDYPVVQASMIVVASIFVFVNLTVDILYTFIDPRIKR